ncbi:MAG: aminotransferase class I/II-fold pyridoxal phosphate-dependent enzyme [Anaerolineae bacterium]|nr:aminotransferase class I/II-fold pyridoxal phosphate-dependent enzyme [Anaerolineae bacterium]
MTKITPAARIASFKPYFFATLTQQIAKLRAQGMEVIRIDMGSPDLPPPDFIIDSLIENAKRPDVHGYAPMGGTLAFKQAVAQYYKSRFDVDLDPAHEILGLIGSKEGLFHLSQVLIDQGDTVLVPNPGYPVYRASGIIAGANVYDIPLMKENGFLPDFSSIPADIARRAKILWLNYPNNPTGATAPLRFFQDAIDFGRQYNIIIAHDAPYCDVCYGDYRAPSILQIPGAREVAIEFNSLSKTYNMAGWRLGMAIGNPQVIEYLNTYKSQLDTSHFLAIFEAGITALVGDQSWLVERNQIYAERMQIVLDGLRAVGFEITPPSASIYIWARLPGGLMNSVQFCEQLLLETGVSTTPGSVYGSHGEGYLRISLGTDTPRIREAVSRIQKWMSERGNS